MLYCVSRESAKSQELASLMMDGLFVDQDRDREDIEENSYLLRVASVCERTEVGWPWWTHDNCTCVLVSPQQRGREDSVSSHQETLCLLRAASAMVAEVGDERKEIPLEASALMIYSERAR